MVSRGSSFLLVFLLTLSGFAGELPAPRHVDLKASDGTNLRATYYAAAKPGPGVVLLHMCNSERQAWREVARGLAAAGIHAITFDYRGYGESGGDRFLTDAQKQQTLINEKWPADIDLAFDYLASQPGVDKTRIGAGGASCGVNQAVQLARRHPEVRSLVLLAGATNRDGREFLRTQKWMPVFTSAATDDGFDGDAPRTMRWYADFSGNPRNRFVGYDTGGHGTQMFAAHTDLPKQLVAWYAETLVKAPPDRDAKVAVKSSPVAEFWTLLEEPGGVEKAAKIFREARTRDPKAFFFPEGVMNQVAYERLQAREFKDAVELAKLNTEAYPNSANTFDSLGDAYLAAGEQQLALQATQKAIAMIEADKNPANAQFNVLIRQSAEQKLARLRPVVE